MLMVVSDGDLLYSRGSKEVRSSPHNAATVGFVEEDQGSSQDPRGWRCGAALD